VLVGQKIILTIIGLIRRNENNIKHRTDIRNKRNLLPQAAESGDDDGYQGTLSFCRHANLILFEDRNRLYSLLPWLTGGQQDEFFAAHLIACHGVAIMPLHTFCEHFRFYGKINFVTRLTRLFTATITGRQSREGVDSQGVSELAKRKEAIAKDSCI